jgi:phosphopantothenoylcysteine decarboxylase/phosphopantothenate--cysteine ligase
MMEATFPLAPFAGKRIHLGVCGSIAAYKALDLLRAFYKAELRLSVALTQAGSRFVPAMNFRALGAEAVYTSMFGPEGGNGGEAFAHLGPGALADAFLIAPASATTLARLAAGLADEILSAQALAWPGSLLLAPAMNPRMWQNAATRENCAVLERRGHILIRPESGKVACGDEGEGRFPDPRVIFLHTLKMLSPQDLAGRKIMLTIGPTREAWDGVRFWSNHSTGLMGAALAQAAWLRGAEVHALCGPGTPWLSSGIQRLDLSTAALMFEAARDLWPGMDVGVFAAAVADFSPEPWGGGKFKKDSAAAGFSIRFLPNRDILAVLGQAKRPGQICIGFAAESGDLERCVRSKLQNKHADLIVGNLIGVQDSGFAGRLNTALLHDCRGRLEQLPTMPKADLAWRILDWLLTL